MTFDKNLSKQSGSEEKCPEYWIRIIKHLFKYYHKFHQKKETKKSNLYMLWVVLDLALNCKAHLKSCSWLALVLDSWVLGVQSLGRMSSFSCMFFGLSSLPRNISPGQIDFRTAILCRPFNGNGWMDYIDDHDGIVGAPWTNIWIGEHFAVKLRFLSKILSLNLELNPNEHSNIGNSVVNKIKFIIITCSLFVMNIF